MAEKDVKPALFPEGGKGLVITAINPNSPQGGSSNIIRNFLQAFDADSFVIASAKSRSKERRPLLPVKTILSDFYQYRRPLRKILGELMKRRDISKVQYLINQEGIKNILIVYPHLYNVEVFLGLKLLPGTRVVGYFHDTFIEGQYGKFAAAKLMQLHELLRTKIDKLFVMNEGMRALYKAKYDWSCAALEHSFPEHGQLAEQKVKNIENKFFWGGNIVDYNAKSLSRIIKVALELNYKFEIASRQNSRSILNFLDNNSFEKTFYGNREDYLLALQTSSFLILALCWPDETGYHEDEISTIFSTKAIEYMTSGVPIILHAPKHYFMSQFILDNGIGYVLDTRDASELLEKCMQIIESDHTEMIGRAKKTSAMFDIKTIQTKWLKSMNSFYAD